MQTNKQTTSHREITGWVDEWNRMDGWKLRWIYKWTDGGLEGKDGWVTVWIERLNKTIFCRIETNF